jgi:hypothetical protein
MNGIDVMHPQSPQAARLRRDYNCAEVDSCNRNLSNDMQQERRRIETMTIGNMIINGKSSRVKDQDEC